MNEQRDYTVYAQQGGTMTVRNKVLRQTYTLLALSLIPTVFGAWLGMATGLNLAMAQSPGMTMIVFLVGAFGLMFGISGIGAAGMGELADSYGIAWVFGVVADLPLLGFATGLLPSTKEQRP